MDEKELWLPTNDFADCFKVKGATVRRSYCVNGHYLGIVPKKLPNNRLLWPRSKVNKILDPRQPVLIRKHQFKLRG